jgi:hypothetical protein
MSGRCCACNSILTPFEITRKYAESGEFVGLCNPCLRTIPDFPDVVERNDLRKVDDVVDFEESDDEQLDSFLLGDIGNE